MNIPHVSEATMDRLFEARALWERGEYLNATHSVGRIAMDGALDQMNLEIQAGQRFEEVFGGGSG